MKKTWKSKSLDSPINIASLETFSFSRFLYNLIGTFWGGVTQQPAEFKP